jgi:hypothetical protein
MSPRYVNRRKFNISELIKSKNDAGCPSIQWCTEGGGGRGFEEFKPTPPKFRSFDKAEPNSQFRGKYIQNNLLIKWVSLICELSGTPD